MAKRLFIGGLPYSTTEEELKALLSQAGPVVLCTLIIDRAMNRSKGFAFAEFDTDETADKAISMFNGYKLGDRNLVVNVARPLEERAPGGGSFGDRRGDDRPRRPGFNRGGSFDRGGNRGGFSARRGR